MTSNSEEISINFDDVKHGLRPLDLSHPTHPSEKDTEYLAYYDIDFSKHSDHINHFFGVLPVGLSSGKKINIAVHYFRPQTSTRTALVVHGFTDHVGLYGQLFDYLLHRGCGVLAFDLPGHGLSDGEQLHIDSFGDYSLVFQQVLAYTQKNIGGPLHLFSQSMGGAISMDYLLGQQFEVDGDPFDKVILLAPLVKPAGWFMIRLSYLILSPLVSSVKRKFTQSSNDAEFLDFQKNKDPLQARRIPVAWVSAMIRWVRRFRKLNWSEKPVMIIQGQKDKTVNFKYGLKMIKEKFPNAKVMRLTEARHHLVCEDEKNFSRVVHAADLFFERRSKSRD